MRRRWGVLISGRGSNLAALLELREEIDIRVVISSNPNAYGLVRAKRAGVATGLTPLLPQTKKIDWLALDENLRSRHVTHLFLAGFMKVLPSDFVAKWSGRMLNLHPSLLPAYPGLKSIELAHRDGAAVGLSVHEVTEEVDAGRIIYQRRCLNPEEVRRYSLAETEFLVHIDEQRAVKEAVRRWSR